MYLKSHLGTGKTEAIHKLLRENPSLRKVLYISFRKTFTQTLASRFSDLGSVLMYSDQRGDLYHQCKETFHRVVIVQVEALCRYADRPDLIVVDEIESVLSQAASPYALQQTDIVARLRALF